jgi:hypothetical protein
LKETFLALSWVGLLGYQRAHESESLLKEPFLKVSALKKLRLPEIQSHCCKQQRETIISEVE